MTNDAINLRKSFCRSHKCTRQAVVLVRGGGCAYLLCAAHAKSAAAGRERRGETVTTAPAALCNPDPDLDRRKALQVAGIFNDESDI